MSGEGVATETREAEFKVEVKSEDDLIVLLRATFKSLMNACELAYRRGNKQALMAALQIHFGLRQPAGLPPPEWLVQEFNAACLSNPKSWDDVFGKPVRGKGKETYTAFLVAQEHRGAGARDKIAAIADKICKSEGTARALYYGDAHKMWLEGRPSRTSTACT